MDERIRAGMAKAGLPGALRHLFLCPGPDCCATDAGMATWEYIKKRIGETRLPAMRTKAQCLRICSGGPWLVIYPDGIWYGAVTPQRFERILEEHLIGGRPVTEWIEARNDFDGPGVCAGSEVS